MAATQHLCDICDKLHVAKPSTVWCPECEQAFCDDCNVYHGVSKLSKHHVTVSMLNHLSMSSSSSQISNMCMEHNEQYQMLCQAHDELVCLNCIEKHDGCKGIVPLNNVIENVKKSSLFQETLQSLKDINANIKTIQSELKKQQGSIKQQEDTMLSQITDTRNKINDHFDKLEEKIRNEIFEITRKSNDCVKQTLQMLESRNTDSNNAKQQLQNMERYATNLQTYLGLRKIQKEAAITGSYLHSIIGDHSLDEITFPFKLDDKICTISDDIQIFGSVKEHKTPCELSLVTHKSKQAQLVATKIKPITDLKIRLVKTTTTGVSDIKGVVVLPSGNIALSDKDPKCRDVVIFSIDWKKLSKISINPAYAFDVTYIDNKTVAVTSCEHTRKGINIIDIDTEVITKYISTNYQCYGITHYNGSLFVCAPYEGIFKLNPSNGSSTCIVQADLPSWSYIEIFDNKMYYTNDFYKTVVCCDIDGKSIWTFRNVDILKYPHGISLDNSGNVYVACSSSNSVMVLSLDGKNNKQILSQDDGLQFPFALHFDRHRNRLFVANGKQTVFEYEVVD